MRFFTLVLLALLMSLTVIHAQEDVTISIAVPIVNEDEYTAAIDEFMAQNPGIRVDIITNPFTFGPQDTPEDITEQLSIIRDAAAKTDVVPVDSSLLGVEATRAGYFLDITPLVNVDAALSEGEFYDAMWLSYQWDGGIWALPYAGDVTMLYYNPDDFDNEEILYPDPAWTLLDLENAIRTLTEYDENDNVSRSAVIDATQNKGIYAVMLNVLGHGLYDDLVQPSVPQYNDPALEGVLDIWAEIQRDGLLGVNTGGFSAPMLLAPSSFAFAPQIQNEYEVVTLPGGRPNVEVNAYAISAGTQHPDSAYELAKFLTFSREIAELDNDIPARRSLAEEVSLSLLDPVDADQIRQALESALPVSEMRFTDPLEDVLSKMVLQNLDARTALNEVEFEVLDRLQFASDRFGAEQLVVRGREEIVLAPGEIALNFGVSSILSPLPTQNTWDQLIEDFVINDPEVGHVSVEIQQDFFSLTIEDYAAAYDCFYLPDNEVPGTNLSLLRNLDPLITTDPTFDQSDFVGNVFTQVQREGQTWAIPLVIQPEVMFYDADVFNQYGAFTPASGWTVPEFEDALRTIKARVDDPPPFVPRSLGGTYIQVLLASYGGLAIDYRVQPAQVNFNDPAVMDAARQVLDLAKDGYIQYDGLAENLGFNIFGSSTPEQIAIYNRLLNAIGDFIPGFEAGEGDQLVTFPQGVQLNAVAYDMGTAYISADTQYAEACYRFLRALSDEPDLFNEMPARRSHINSNTLLENQGQDAVSFYQALDALLQQPETVAIPTPLGLSIESADVFLATLWLNRAFDRYVFDDADLELELNDAQQFATEFLTCSNAIPVVNPSEDEEAFEEYAEQVVTCATDVDPTFGELLGIE